jgi:hypothetical protein
VKSETKPSFPEMVQVQKQFDILMQTIQAGEVLKNSDDMNKLKA